MDSFHSSDGLMSAAEAASRLGDLPVAIIGAGPVGLAAAVHLIARGLDPLILEAGMSAGTALRDWGHVPMFSPWLYDIDQAARALLERDGWQAPDDEAYPTGLELAERYVDPLSRNDAIAPRLRLGVRVTGVARVGNGKVRTNGRAEQPFEVRTIDRDGREGRVFARAVIDASGTWFSPNRAGSSGLPAIGEQRPDTAARIRYGMPDVLGGERERYAGKRVAVVGSGHSATGNLIDLARLAGEAPGTEITWVARSAITDAVFGGGSSDQLAARGALGTRLKELAAAGSFTLLAPFAIDEIVLEKSGLQVVGVSGNAERTVLEVDELVVAAGLKPDLGLLAELRTDLDPALDCPRALGPLIDPNLHSCGTVRPHGAAELTQPEPNLFIIGMKAYGRAPTFLLATGYEQARSVAAFLAGDHQAAARVELSLPETGVCSGPAPKAGPTPTRAACCGPAAAQAAMIDSEPARTQGGCCG